MAIDVQARPKAVGSGTASVVTWRPLTGIPVKSPPERVIVMVAPVPFAVNSSMATPNEASV